MTSAQRSMGGSPITPIEPSAHRGGAEGAGRQAAYTTAFSRIDAAVASSRGSHHANNEDAHADLDGSGGLFIVADGVGGGALAQVASRLLVTQLQAALDGHRLDAERVRTAMLHADRTIARAIAQQTELPGAATVVLCAPVDRFASKWLIGWVGDCRAYVLARGAGSTLELLTRDDTFRILGESPPLGGALDDPARMVGNGATSGANVAFHDLGSGDLLALCSDGVHKYVEASDWEHVLRRPVALAQRCKDLIATARASGSVDDATVLLLQRAGFAMRRPRWITRFGERDIDGASQT